MVISFIGMATQEVAIKANLQIFLKADAEVLDEVMVVAYGTAKKLHLRGSLNNFSKKILKDIPINSFEEVLQGSARCYGKQ